MNNKKKIIIIAIVLLVLTVAMVYFLNENKKVSERLAVYSPNSTGTKQQIFPVRTEVQYLRKSSMEHALELVGNVARGLEAQAYKRLKQVKDKEKFVHDLIRAAGNSAEYQLNAEQNDGRGPVDFVLTANNERTQIEVKMASNTRLKHVSKQLEAYASANGINSSVAVIVYTSEKEAKKAQKVKDGASGISNLQTVLIDATDKPSGSRVV